MAAVGRLGLHRRVAVFFEQGHGKAAAGEGVGGGHTGDTAANDGPMDVISVRLRTSEVGAASAVGTARPVPEPDECRHP